MKATARRVGTYRHEIAIREHGIAADEPSELGGGDSAPSPQELLAASLASCTAITMEMYATRKGLELPDVEVAVEYQPAERGCPTRFDLVVRIPADVSEEDAQRLMTIAAKCPVHRTLEGEVMFSERLERAAAPARAACPRQQRRRCLHRPAPGTPALAREPARPEVRPPRPRRGRR